MSFRKEKEEALAEANARHVIIERHTNSIAGLERQLQEHVQKLEEKDEQVRSGERSCGVGSGTVFWSLAVKVTKHDEVEYDDLKFEKT